MVFAAVLAGSCGSHEGGPREIPPVADTPTATATAPTSLIDARHITIRFAGADEAILANPRMDYRFSLALTNNSLSVLNTVEGVVSVRSRGGSDILVNHPFRAVDLGLAVGQTQTVVIDLPVASSVVDSAALRFEVVSASTN